MRIQLLSVAASTLLAGCSNTLFLSDDTDSALQSLYGEYRVTDSRNNRSDIVLARLSRQDGQTILMLHDRSSGQQILYHIASSDCRRNTEAASVTCLFGPYSPDRRTSIGPRFYPPTPPLAPSAATDPQPTPHDMEQFRGYPAGVRPYPPGAPGVRLSFTLAAVHDKVVRDAAFPPCTSRTATICP